MLTDKIQKQVNQSYYSLWNTRLRWFESRDVLLANFRGIRLYAPFSYITYGSIWATLTADCLIEEEYLFDRLWLYNSTDLTDKWLAHYLFKNR